MLSSTAIAKVKEDFYTLAQAAMAVNVNPATVWRWIKIGKIEAHRIGREVLIEKSEVEKLRK